MNGYFQLVMSENDTKLRLIPPTNGGAPIIYDEAAEYLTNKGVTFDVVSLGKAIATGTAQDVVLNLNAMREVRQSYKLTFAADNMSATVRFYPPSTKGECLSYDEFVNDLKMRNIVFGIYTDEIKNFLMEPMYCTDFIVAQGKEPRQGNDAYIEYYFETDLNAKPTLKEDGSVDFFNLNTICKCSKGQILARLFPEDRGDNGTNIRGDVVKPRDVKRTTLRFGRNISINEERTILTSDVEGHVTLTDGQVFVSDVLTVENVDNSTGNIDYDGSVEVNGNVFANFSVKCKGDITVKGTVEGAYLEAGGNIVLNRGMNGMGKGELKAEGNIIVKFLENAKATAGNNLIAESILHSVVVAENDVDVTGRKGFITGGKVTAGRMIEVRTLGAAMGADTIVEVGGNPRVKLRIAEIQKLIAENGKVLQTVQPVLTATQQKLERGVKLSPEQLKYVQGMAVLNKQKQDENKELMEELDGLMQALSTSEGAQVRVNGEVFTGTRICIGDVSMVVPSEMRYCKFVKSQGDVKMVSL